MAPTDMGSVKLTSWQADRLVRPTLVLPQHYIIQLHRLHAAEHLDLLVTDVLCIQANLEGDEWSGRSY